MIRRSPGLRERLHLAREDGVEPKVVAGRRDQRRVGRQRDGRIGAAVSHVANDVLRRHVLRVGGAPAVAAEEQRAPRRDRLLHQAERPFQVRPELLADLQRAARRAAAVPR